MINGRIQKNFKKTFALGIRVRYNWDVKYGQLAVNLGFWEIVIECCQ